MPEDRIGGNHSSSESISARPIIDTLYDRVLQAVVGRLMTASNVRFRDIRKHITLGDVYCRVIRDLLTKGIITADEWKEYASVHLVAEINPDRLIEAFNTLRTTRIASPRPNSEGV